MSKFSNADRWDPNSVVAFPSQADATAMPALVPSSSGNDHKFQTGSGLVRTQKGPGLLKSPDNITVIK
jgi:hypothetical protein